MCKDKIKKSFCSNIRNIIGNYWLFGILIVLLGASIVVNISDIVVSSQSIVITFIGILATFVVVGNYAQMKSAEEKAESAKHEVVKLEGRIKNELERRFSEIESGLKSVFSELESKLEGRIVAIENETENLQKLKGVKLLRVEDIPDFDALRDVRKGTPIIIHFKSRNPQQAFLWEFSREKRELVFIDNMSNCSVENMKNKEHYAKNIISFDDVRSIEKITTYIPIPRDFIPPWYVSE